MKAMPFVLAFGAVASLAIAPASFAATCPDRAPAAITSPLTDAGRACQNEIAKSALSYLKTQLKTDTKCMAAGVPGACPSAKDTEKKQKAALKASDKVVKACTGALADLASSYSTNGVSDPADVASCTLSQNNAEGRLLAYKVNGTPGILKSNKDGDKCIKTLNSAGTKYALSAMQTINKCLAAAIKAGVAGDLSESCVGQWSGGSFTAPTNPKAADGLSKALAKLDSSIVKACGPVTPAIRSGIFACPGAVSDADYVNCIACGAWDSTLDILAAQYSETGTFVAHGANALQTAVDTAPAGAKLLIESGLYQEDVSMTDNSADGGTQFVGCGGASEDRPQLQPPTIGGPYLNGVFAAGVDGLVFQSLDVSGGWEENGIFVTGADGVVFRDLVTDGSDGSSECVLGPNDGAACSTAADCPSGVCTPGKSIYGIFPVESSNVLVETSSAVNIRDAGIYVGSSHNVMMRYNTATASVAGMELENSSNGVVHNNYMSDNVGGLLIFKLPGPPVQAGNDHEVMFNVMTANNVAPNFCLGGSVCGIPPGTGVVILSTRNSVYHHNLVTDNMTYGITAIDQQAFDALAGGPLGGSYSHSCAAPDAPYKKCTIASQAIDCPLSLTCNLDQKMEYNQVHSNTLKGNGLTPPPGSVSPGDAVYAVIEEDPAPDYNHNCFNNGVATKQPLTAPANHLSALCP